MGRKELVQWREAINPYVEGLGKFGDAAQRAPDLTVQTEVTQTFYIGALMMLKLLGQIDPPPEASLAHVKLVQTWAYMADGFGKLSEGESAAGLAQLAIGLAIFNEFSAELDKLL